MSAVPLQSRISNIQRRSLAVGMIATGVCAIGAVSNIEQLLRSYLAAYLFWWGIAVGCLILTMITHLIDSRWGPAARPYLAAGIGTLPLLAILFVPIVIGLDHIYVWAREEVVRADHQLQKKIAYLNPTGFEIRAAAYFLIWLLSGWTMGRFSTTANRSAEVPSEWLPKLSGIGLVLMVFSTTFAAFDWSMSLEPHWYSTAYGLVIGVGGVLTAMAFVILIFSRLELAATEFDEVVDEKESETSSVLSDLATLLLAFLMLWAYLSISQFLIIWSGNLPAESHWYLRRLQGGWEWIALGLVLFHFALPFLLLLSRDVKSNPQAMLGVTLLILVMHWAELFWNVIPAFHTDGLKIHWLDVVLPVGIGGLWMSAFCWHLQRGRQKNG